MEHTPPLPASFVQRVREVWGAEGEAWLARFHHERADLAARWGLTMGEPFALSYNYVTRAVRNRDGLPVVLKMGVPTEEFQSEVAALEYYGGRGCVQPLQTDYQRGAVLLPYIFPGETLKSLTLHNDDQATQIVAHIMRQLHTAPAPNASHLTPDASLWPTAERWGRALTEPNVPTPQIAPALRDRAAKLYEELCASSGAAVLLHADLHHENILRGPNGYVAIDAKGVWGEPEYEVGTLMYNPAPGTVGVADLKVHLGRRLDILAGETGYDRARMKDWAFAQAILSAVWDFETANAQDTPSNLSQGGQATLHCAEALM